jgi:NYN domain
MGEGPQSEGHLATLRYPRNWPQQKEEEKGIDVALAIDFVTMAVRGEYDVGVIMSTDTDLKPALEAVAEMGGNPYPRAEVAAWSTLEQHSRRLSIPGRRLWCHWLDEADYRSVADPTDYTRP